MFSQKSLVFVAVICFGTSSVYASISAADISSMYKALHPFIVDCLKDYDVSEQQVADLKENGKPVDINPCFMSCSMKNSGAFDSKGFYVHDKAAELTRPHIKNDEDWAIIYKISEDCTKVNDNKVNDGDQGCERAKMLFECFNKHKGEVKIEG